MYLSVVICTHNPRIDYLEETLDALKAQTLPRDQWELLIIDNASEAPLETRCDLSWHPKSRILREEKLGVMHARLRGIEETQSELIVYVDDDNLLEANYLEAAVRLAKNYDWLGTFGAATLRPRYEVEPAPELVFYCGNLALRNDAKDLFTNIPQTFFITPFCAGMGLRREVAMGLLNKKRSATGPTFGRKGASLFSSEDLEFSLIAADMGFAYGIFADLTITHLIPARRVTPKYLLDLNEAMTHSNELLARLRSREMKQPVRPAAREFVMMAGWAFRMVKSRGMERRFQWRRVRGQWKALRDYRRLVRTTLSQS